MPAITADTLTLPRLPELTDPSWRGVYKVVTAQKFLEGEGFQVRRPFPGTDLALADPFLLLDHMGAVEYGPGEAKGTPWHPHRGFETVTYMIDGAFQHTDSIGGGGLITDGATQWMTAGGGILHQEVPPQDMIAKGGLFHGVQLWVNLPRALKMTTPRYQDIRATDAKLLSSDDGDALTAQAADTQPSNSPTGWEILVLGGLPINEPVARYGPFVMNTREEILQAFEDYQAGRLGQIPAEHLAHRTSADDRLD